MTEAHENHSNSSTDNKKHLYSIMETTDIKVLDKVVVRFSGDSGDGMQLAGNIFTNVSAGVGNQVSTFPDYPAEIRAPQALSAAYRDFR